jgi:hypothetical protein
MSRLVDNLITLRVLRLFTMRYEDTQAYKLGIINDKGEQLIKMSHFTTGSQSDAYTILHRLVFRLRGLLEKVPFVKNRLANYAAALLLIKEKIVKEEEFFETDDVLLEKLDAMMHRPGFYLAEQAVRKQWEDAAANATGPAVAGTGDDSSTVVVRKKKRKTAMFTVTPDVFSRFAKGKKKFERWSKYLNVEDEAEASIYNFARRNPDGMIILQCADTGNQKAIRYNPNGGGRWKKLQRPLRPEKVSSLKEWIDVHTD